MRCLILKQQDPKLEKCRSYLTKRYINYNDALRPNILVFWGALCGYSVGSLAFNVLVLVYLLHFSRSKQNLIVPILTLVKNAVNIQKYIFHRTF